MSKQTAHTVLMVEPTHFGFNEEAYQTNSFQNKPDSSTSVQERALEEFDNFVKQLNEKGVNVLVFRDFSDSQTPDSIFPNNWFSTHRSGDLLTYPMAVSNRRQERRSDIIDDLLKRGNYRHTDFAIFEKDEAYLEGTGSLIFDHDNRTVYAALSPRTHRSVLERVAAQLDYEAIAFTAFGKGGELIYHTNVMMCVGRSFIAIGLETIQESDRAQVLSALKQSGKSIIELNNDQVYNHFAGNMLQVENQDGESVLVLSDTAYQSLSDTQLALFEQHNDHIVHVAIPTIEHVGGGSARCMLAEIFFPNLDNLNS